MNPEVLKEIEAYDKKAAGFKKEAEEEYYKTAAKPALCIYVFLGIVYILFCSYLGLKIFGKEACIIFTICGFISALFIFGSKARANRFDFLNNYVTEKMKGTPYPSLDDGSACPRPNDQPESDLTIEPTSPSPSDAVCESSEESVAETTAPQPNDAEPQEVMCWFCGMKKASQTYRIKASTKRKYCMIFSPIKRPKTEYKTYTRSAYVPCCSLCKSELEERDSSLIKEPLGSKLNGKLSGRMIREPKDHEIYELLEKYADSQTKFYS